MNIIKIRPSNWLLPMERDRSSVNPWSLHREIDKLFANAFTNIGRPSDGEAVEGVMSPKIDISSTEQEYLISAELPGIEEKNIELEVLEGVLTIKAHREHESKNESNDEKKNYYRVERHYGMFQRVLQLPEDADSENIAANYKNGVLNISVSRKIPQKNEAKKITIS